MLAHEKIVEALEKSPKMLVRDGGAAALDGRGEATSGRGGATSKDKIPSSAYQTIESIFGSRTNKDVLTFGPEGVAKIWGNRKGVWLRFISWDSLGLEKKAADRPPKAQKPHQRTDRPAQEDSGRVGNADDGIRPRFSGLLLASFLLASLLAILLGFYTNHLSNDVAIRENEIAQLNMEIEAAEACLVESLLRVDELKCDERGLSANIVELRLGLESAEVRLRKEQGRVGELEGEERNLSGNIEGLRADLEAAEACLLEDLSRVDELECEERDLSRKIVALRKDLEAAGAFLVEERNSVGELEGEVRRLSGNMEQMEAALEVAEARLIESNQQWQTDSFLSRIAQLREEFLAGVSGSISQLDGAVVVFPRVVVRNENPFNDEIIEPIATEMLKLVDDNRDVVFMISGHADDDGDPRNQEFSERRANRFYDQIVAAGVPECNLESAGYGANWALPRDAYAMIPALQDAIIGDLTVEEEAAQEEWSRRIEIRLRETVAECQ